VDDTPKSPADLSSGDITHLRYLAIAWGAIIAGTWLVFDDARMQLIMTAAQLGMLGATLFSIYLLRRWRNRK
jgi:hypothetical protein